jgi:hypothetical protein
MTVAIFARAVLLNAKPARILKPAFLVILHQFMFISFKVGAMLHVLAVCVQVAFSVCSVQPINFLA